MGMIQTDPLKTNLSYFCGLDTEAFGRWQVDDDGQIIIIFEHGYIWIKATAPYCVRANWVAYAVTCSQVYFPVSETDYWPRPYYDLAVALKELEIWLIRNRHLQVHTDTESTELVRQVRSNRLAEDAISIAVTEAGAMVRAEDPPFNH